MTKIIHIQVPSKVIEIATAVKNIGGTLFVVGGAVRNYFTGEPIKDFDCEVHGISVDELVEMLSGFGKVNAVGRQFGVLKVTIDGQEFDFSVPRRDNKVASSSKGFIVEFDPTITLVEAASRRDFTVNALMFNPLTSEVHDFFDGINHINMHILKPVSDAFTEDSLRVVRGARFAAQLGFIPFGSNLFAEAAKEFSTVPKDRIREEFEKIFKGKRPGDAILFFEITETLYLFPELFAIQEIEQDKVHHPEGGVMVHTMYVMNEAAQIARANNYSDEDTMVLVAAAMCHDLGKATHTQVSDDGRITSHGHEGAGEAPTRSLLARLGFNQAFIERVVPLVTCHMRHNGFNGHRREIRRLMTVCPDVQMLIHLILADHSGRPPKPQVMPAKAKAMLDLFKTMQAEGDSIKPLLKGQHLIERGFKQGREIGKILAQALEAQIEGEFTDVEGAIAWFEASVK